jgi:pimeloyl-ACP methyl ester carboxylesterase
MPYITIKDHKVRYIAVENANKMGHGETLFFLHGLGGNIYNWAYQIKHFSDSYQVIALELPGHGRSPGKGATSIEDYTALLHGFFEAMHLDKIILIGHSMGGAIALDYALKYQGSLKALGLVAAGAKFEISTQTLIKMKDNIESIFGALDKAKEKMKDIDERLVTNDLNVMMGDVVAARKFNVTKLLPQVRIPTLIVCGTEDPLISTTTVEYLRDHIPEAQLFLIEGAGHMVMVESNKEFNTILEQFVITLVVNSLWG